MTIMKVTPDQHSVAEGIHSLSKDESEALEGYERFLKTSGHFLDTEDILMLREIIAEEKKHSNMLAQMVLKYDGNINAEPYQNTEPYPGASEMIHGGPATDKPKTLSQP